MNVFEYELPNMIIKDKNIKKIMKRKQLHFEKNLN